MRRALIIGSSIALMIALPIAIGCGLGILFFPFSPFIAQFLLMSMLLSLMGCGGCFYSPWRFGFYSYGLSPWRMSPPAMMIGGLLMAALFMPLPFLMIGFGIPFVAAIVIGSIAAAVSVAAIVGLTVGLCMQDRDAVVAAPAAAASYHPPVVMSSTTSTISVGPGPLYYPYPPAPLGAYPGVVYPAGYDPGYYV